MPTYDYHCEHCNTINEHFHSITFEGIIKCFECGKPMKRLISGGCGIIFKGTGFYETDYKRKKKSEKKKDM